MNIAYKTLREYIAGLEEEIINLRQRTVIAHQVCNLLRLAYPEISELSDNGCLHEAIHDIHRVQSNVRRGEIL